MKKKFWKIKKLEQFTKDEWEALCDGCGKCCLLKIEDEETGIIEFTNVSCKLLSTRTCKCLKYEERHNLVDDCIKLDYKNIKKIKKVLDNPLTVVHNEYVERVNIKGYDEWLKLPLKR